jgi:hypothetical protein
VSQNTRKSGTSKRQLRRGTKMKVYEVMISPALLYENETHIKLEAVEMIFFRVSVYIIYKYVIMNGVHV